MRGKLSRGSVSRLCFMMAIILTAGLLPVTQSAYAARTVGSIFQAFTGGMPVSVKGQSFFDATFNVTPGNGPVLISANVDGTGAVMADDEIFVQVTRPDGTSLAYGHDFSSGCAGYLTPWGPINFDSYMQPGGVNKMRIILRDRCGESMGAYTNFALVYNALPTVSVSDVTVTEGDAGTTAATFALTLSDPISTQVTVDYRTVDGSARAGSDYVAKTGQVTFAPGVKTASVSVSVVGDFLAEGNETFSVVLSGPQKATIGRGTGIGTIRDDDLTGKALAIGDVTVIEGTGGTTNATFAVLLSQASTAPITVAFNAADGTATLGDYLATSGMLTFAPGDIAKSITVPVVGDSVGEPDETFFVNLSGSNAPIVKGQGLGTILNDDRRGVFTCRASAVSLPLAVSALRSSTVEPVVANPANRPCVDHRVNPLAVVEDYGAFSLPLAREISTLGVQIAFADGTVLDAMTDQTPNNLAANPPSAGDSAFSLARATSVTVLVGGTAFFRADKLSASAAATCPDGGGPPVLRASSTVVGTGSSLPAPGGGTTAVGILPKPTDVIDVPVRPGTTIHLNATIQTSQEIVRRALWIQTPSGDIIVSEARAGFVGNPCAI